MDDQRTDRTGSGAKWLNRARISAAVFFGIVCMLSIAFWVRGYYRYQAVFLKLGPIICAAGAYGGYMCFSIYPARDDRPSCQVNDWPMDRNVGVVTKEAKSTSFFGFGGKKSQKGAVVLYVPAWFFTIGSGAVSLLLWRVKTFSFTVRNLLIATALVAAILGLAIYPK